MPRFHRQVTSALDPDALDQTAIAAMERQAQNRKVASAAFSQLVHDVSSRAEETLVPVLESLPLPADGFQGLTLCAPDLEDLDDRPPSPGKQQERGVREMASPGMPERGLRETTGTPAKASALGKVAELWARRKNAEHLVFDRQTGQRLQPFDFCALAFERHGFIAKETGI